MKTNQKQKAIIFTLTFLLNVIAFLMSSGQMEIKLMNEAQAKSSSNTQVSFQINFQVDGFSLLENSAFLSSKFNYIRTLKTQSLDFLPQVKNPYKATYRKTVSSNDSIVISDGPQIKYAQTNENGQINKAQKVLISTDSDQTYLAQGMNLDTAKTAKNSFESVSSQNKEILQGCQASQFKTLEINQGHNSQNCNFVVASSEQNKVVNIVVSAH